MVTYVIHVVSIIVYNVLFTGNTNQKFFATVFTNMEKAGNNNL